MTSSHPALEPDLRLLHITTVPMSLGFLRGQVDFMIARGFKVHAISSPGYELQEFGKRHCVIVHAVKMERRIAPARDLVALWRIATVIRKYRPHVIHAHTPKGGLLGMLAAKLTGVPVRLYHMRGLPLMTASGLKRVLLRWAEIVSCGCAQTVLCNSESIRQVAIGEAICRPEKIRVLQSGSGQGVDATTRFNPERIDRNTKLHTRSRCGIPDGARVLGFVGRIVRDKGIVELAAAWAQVRERFSDLHLLLVGPFEEQDPIPQPIRRQFETDPRVHLIGADWNTPPLYSIMDLVTLPTYREGFPNVPLEAAAMTVPVVATRVPGCVEAVVSGITGMLVPPRDPSALAQAITRYLEDSQLRREHGIAGRQRVLLNFRPEDIWAAMYEEYRRLLFLHMPQS